MTTEHTNTTMSDTDDTVTYRPPLRRVIRGLISDYGSITDDLLVAMTHAETDTAPDTIRDVVDTLESQGEIYNASGDATAPRWKVARP